MASIIAAAGFLTYEKVRSHRAKKKAKKEQHNASRYSELQNDKANAIGEKGSVSASSSCEDLSEGERERGEKVGRGKSEEASPPAYDSLGGESRGGGGLSGRRRDSIIEVGARLIFGPAR